MNHLSDEHLNQSYALYLQAVEPEAARLRDSRFAHRALAVGAAVIAAITIPHFVMTGESSSSSTSPTTERAASSTELPVTLETPSETIITSDTTPIPEVVELIPASTTTTTLAPAPSAEATTILPAATNVPVTEAAPVLSLTEQIRAGQTELKDHMGMRIGSLVLETCDVVDVYVANPVKINSYDNFQRFTPEAQAEVLEYKGVDPTAFVTLTPEVQKDIIDADQTNPSLSHEQLLMLEDDVKQRGVINGTGTSGDNMFDLKPAGSQLDGCVPNMVNTRAAQPAYGSTEATQHGKEGGFAIDYQAVADMLPEFKAIPGGGGVTYIEGHRSSQSAAFNSLSNYMPGNTVDYIGDDRLAFTYQMLRRESIDGDITIDDLVQRLTTGAAGQEWLVLQVCIDGQPNNRALYYFTRV